MTEEDLQFFKDRVERDVVLPGASGWQHMMNKNFNDVRYSAWKRSLAVGSLLVYCKQAALHRF